MSIHAVGDRCDWWISRYAGIRDGPIKMEFSRRRHAEYYQDMLEAAAQKKAATDDWRASGLDEL
jgi:hypothetical protein